MPQSTQTKHPEYMSVPSKRTGPRTGALSISFPQIKQQRETHPDLGGTWLRCLAFGCVGRHPLSEAQELSLSRCPSLLARGSARLPVDFFELWGKKTARQKYHLCVCVACGEKQQTSKGEVGRLTPRRSTEVLLINRSDRILWLYFLYSQLHWL